MTDADLDTVTPICDACGEHLEAVHGEGGLSAQWWADKELQEHTDEYH